MDRTATRHETLIAATALIAAFALILTACGSAQTPSTQADASVTATASATLKASTAPLPAASDAPTPVETPPADPTSSPTPSPDTEAHPRALPDTDAAARRRRRDGPRRSGSAPQRIAHRSRRRSTSLVATTPPPNARAPSTTTTPRISGESWTARVFTLAAHRLEVAPRIAFDGGVVYVAYTRYIPDGACAEAPVTQSGCTTGRGPAGRRLVCRKEDRRGRGRAAGFRADRRDVARDRPGPGRALVLREPQGLDASPVSDLARRDRPCLDGHRLRRSRAVGLCRAPASATRSSTAPGSRLRVSRARPSTTWTRWPPSTATTRATSCGPASSRQPAGTARSAPTTPRTRADHGRSSGSPRRRASRPSRSTSRPAGSTS